MYPLMQEINTQIIFVHPKKKEKQKQKTEIRATAQSVGRNLQPEPNWVDSRLNENINTLHRNKTKLRSFLQSKIIWQMNHVEHTDSFKKWKSIEADAKILELSDKNYQATI